MDFITKKQIDDYLDNNDVESLEMLLEVNQATLGTNITDILGGESCIYDENYVSKQIKDEDTLLYIS